MRKIQLNTPNGAERIGRYQMGMSLIELMISMVVGLFLLAGVVTNFISNKDADVKREAISEMDANAHAALNAMRQTITHAGYPSIQNTRFEKAFYTKKDVDEYTNPTCRNGSLRDKLPPSKYTKNTGRADILTVVSLADNPCKTGKSSCANAADVNSDALLYYDCTGGGADRDAHTVSCSTDINVGMSDPTQAKIFSTFRLNKNQRRLFCDGSRGFSQPLVDNIYAMQFLYGVKQSDGNKIYRNAKQVENNDQWGLVNTVQVALLMQSSKKVVLDQETSQTSFTLLDAKINIPSDEKYRLFRVYTTTINLENLN